MPNSMSFITLVNPVGISHPQNEIIPQELLSTPPQHTNPEIYAFQTNQNNEPFH
jgi:hypothetical protein